MSPLPHPVEVFNPPVRLRLRGLDRVTLALVLLFGLSAGFLSGVGSVLVAGAIDQYAPALRCAFSMER